MQGARMHVPLTGCRVRGVELAIGCGAALLVRPVMVGWCVCACVGVRMCMCVYDRPGC